MKPLVSVIVPIYNAAPYLQETLDSIMASTYRPIEVVMVDDGSRDNSLHIAQDFCTHHPECVVIAQDNQGVSVARNNAIRAAKGTYILPVDADDTIADTFIQKAVECGVSRVVPFESENCIVRVKQDAENRKTERRNRIAFEAAKQCGRGILPAVEPTLSFDAMLQQALNANLVLFCYEGEDASSLRDVLMQYHSTSVPNDARKTVAVIIGSEGGFAPKEAERARMAGCMIVNLGPRILRTETASAFVLSALAYEFEL